MGLSHVQTLTFIIKDLLQLTIEATIIYIDGNKSTIIKGYVLNFCLQDGLWGAPPDLSQELVTFPCPPGYCSCTGIVNDSNLNEGCQLLFDQPSAICVSNRQNENSKNNKGLLHMQKLTLLYLFRCTLWKVQGQLWCWAFN